MDAQQLSNEYFIDEGVLAARSINNYIDYYIENIDTIEKIVFQKNSKQLGLWEKFVADNQINTLKEHYPNPLDLKRALFFLDILDQVTICPLRSDDINQHLKYAYKKMLRNNLNFHIIINYSLNNDHKVYPQSWCITLVELQEKNNRNNKSFKIKSLFYDNNADNNIFKLQNILSAFMNENDQKIPQTYQHYVRDDIASELVFYQMLQDCLFLYLENDDISDPTLFLSSYLFSKEPLNELKQIFIEEMINNICFTNDTQEDSHLLSNLDSDQFLLGNNYYI